MADRGQSSYPVDKLKALYELSTAVNSSFSFNELAETAVAQITKSVAPDIVLFYLKENDELLLKGSYQTPGVYSSISPEIREAGVCLCGLAASEKKPLYSKSINKDPLCSLPECRQAGIQSFAALPLHGVNDTIGVLSIASFTSRDFSAEGTFLETLAGHISVALGNILFREVLERKVEALTAQKMEAIGLLAGGIAHDFNNILTAIIGFGSIVKIKMNNDDPLRVHIEQILESANRAAQLTHDLLAFSRKQPLLMKAVDLNRIITGMESLLKRLIGGDITLVTETSGNELTVLADSVQIEQVLINLAANARDAMSGSGSLAIRSGPVEFDSEFISAHCFGEPGVYAVISVADTGVGIDKEEIVKIFEPFFSTKEVGRGAGLGLAVAYGIIKQHKGYIDVYSETGVGTTFRIYLPLIKAGIEEEDDLPAETPQSGTETILIAEDDESLRNLMEIVLKASGFKVIISENGEDAVKKFMENRETIHLCLLDVIMPVKNGIDAYYEIKKARPDIRVIFMSGYTADMMNKSSLPEKDSVYLLKPVEPQALLTKIRELLDK